MDFLFEPMRGPIVAGWNQIMRGDTDLWLWSIAQGAHGRAPAPDTAVLLFLVWVSLASISLLCLRRALS